MTESFKDYFSECGSGYRRFRPTYPVELFAWLAGLTAKRNAWDCATGSGQAAVGLAAFYAKVFATDASAEQLKNASRRDNIDYLLCLAERSCFQACSIDLITVSQAMHWFDFEAFYREAKRVLCDRGVLAFWCYGMSRITPEIDRIVDSFYHEVIGPFWPPERRYIEEEYRTIPLPLEEIAAPLFTARVAWDLEGFLGYLGTWSATRRYAKTRKTDPFDGIRESLYAAWGEADRKREIVWPLSIRVGRKKG